MRCSRKEALAFKYLVWNRMPDQCKITALGDYGIIQKLFLIATTTQSNLTNHLRYFFMLL